MAGRKLGTPKTGGRQKGTPNKATSEKEFTETLRAEIHESLNNLTRLERVAKALIARAESGDVSAITAIADRLEGKPKQVIDGTVEHEHRFVRASEKATDDDWKRYLAHKANPQPVKRVNGKSNGTAH